MRSGAQLSLRIPLVLLALANLAFLGSQLWPWPEVLTLPLNGAVGIDPAVSLLGYIGLIFWITGSHNELTRKALKSATMLGLLAGLFLAAEIAIRAHAMATEDVAQPGEWARSLLAVAVLLWGVAGWRGKRMAEGEGMGLLCGLWSAMVSGLMAATAELVKMHYIGLPSIFLDPWKQYEGLAVGTPATQVLVHSLNSISFFLLVSPLAGGIAGLFFAHFAQKHKG